MPYFVRGMTPLAELVNVGAWRASELGPCSRPRRRVATGTSFADALDRLPGHRNDITYWLAPASK